MERLLRIHFLQHWFNLSDPAAEEALDDSQAMRRFVVIDLGRGPVPDETTLCKFRHLLERHHLGGRLFTLMGESLQEKGLKFGGGTIVDAPLIGAPSSTKNEDRKRDPEMHQTKKGNPMGLWDEGAYRCGQSNQADSLGGRPRGQRARQLCVAGSSPWRRDSPLG